METTSNMYHGELVVINELDVIGRGHILVADLKESGLVMETWVDTIPIVKGDLFDYGGKKYEVMEVDSGTNLLNNKYKSVVGLIVKET